MANELGLLITAGLNQGKSIGEINKAIKELAKSPSLQKLKLNIDIDQSFVKGMNSFVEASKKLSSNLDAQRKVVKETIEEHRALDGTLTKNTKQVLANGEIIEKSRIKHDAQKKAIEAERKSLEDLNISLANYTKVNERVSYNKAGQISNVKNTYKNDTTGSTLTVNTDAEGYVKNYAKLEEYLKLQQSALAQEKAINKQREQVAKEEYNTRKAIADKALKEEEQRNKAFEATLKQRYEFEKNQAAKSEALDKAHYQALQQNKKRDQDYAQSIANTQQKISDAKTKYSGNANAVASLNELETKLRSISNIGDFKSPLNNLNNELKRTVSQLNEGTGHARSFGDSLKSAFQNIVMYAGIGSIFSGATQFLREGISYVNELNKSLTELSIVYMEGQDEVGKYAEKFHELGMEMGITSSELMRGAVEFARQGLSPKDTFSRMETTIKYAKISSLEFAEAAKIMTASINSMNVSAERASDVFSYLGDATASGADEVGQAMQRVGGTAGAIGVEFEKVASWIATMSANSREGAYTIGNSIKSILARMQSMKENGFDEEDGTQVNDVAKALATIGVELVDAQGNFRDFGVVMDEIGGKWDSLTNRQQAYISTTVAGSWQSAKFLGLMSDYGQSVDLYKGALDSAGVSTEKFGLYQQGTEAHIDTMKTALEGLWSSMFKSEGIRSVVDMMTSLLTAITKVTDKFGGLQTIVGTATIAFLLFNRSLPASALNLIGLEATKVGSKIAVMTGGLVSARVAAIGLQLAMGAGLVAAMVLVTSVISKLVTAHQKAKEEQKALAEQQKKIADSWNNQRTHIEDLIEQYNKLNEATNGGKLFADIEQETKYKELVDQIAELMPNLVASIDEKGEKHLKNAAAIQEELKYAQQLADLDNNQIVIDAEDTFKNKIKEIKEFKDEIADLRTKMALGGQFVGSTFIKFDKSELNQMEMSLISLQQKAATATQGVKESLSNVVTSLLSINKVKIDDNVSKQISNVIAGLNLEGLSPEEINSKSNAIGDFALKLAKLQETSYQPLVKQLSNDIRVLGFSLGKTSNEVDLMIASAIDANSVLSKQADALTVVANHTSEAEKVTANLSDTLKDTTDAVTPLNAAIETLREGKRLTAEEILNLIEKEKGFADAVTYENGVLDVNLDKVVALRDGKIQGINDVIKAKEAELKALETATTNELRLYGIQIDGIKSVAQAMQALAQKREEVQKDTYTMMHMQMPGEDDGAKDYLKKLQQDNSNIINMQKSLQAIDTAKKELEALKALAASDTLKTVGTSSDSKDSNKNSDKAAKDLAEIKDATEARIAAINALAAAQAKLNEAYATASSTAEGNNQYAEAIKQQTSLIDGQTKAINLLSNANKTLYSDRAALQNSHKNYKMSSWIGPDGEASQAYTKLYNSMKSGTAQKELQGIFDKYKLLTSAIGENNATIRTTTANQVTDTTHLREQYFKQSEYYIETESQKMRQSGKTELQIAQFVYDSRKRMASEKWAMDRKITKLSADEQIAAEKAVFESGNTLREEHFKHSEKYIEEESEKMRQSGKSEVEIAQFVLEARKRMASEKWTTERKITKLSAEEQIAADKAVYEANKDYNQKRIEEVKKRITKIDAMLTASNSKLTKLEDNLTNKLNNLYSPGSLSSYNSELSSNISLLQQKQVQEQLVEAELRRQMKAVGLTKDEYEDLNTQLIASVQNQIDLATSIGDTSKKIIEQQRQMADDIVSIIKEGYEKQKELALGNIDKQKDAIDKVSEAFEKAQDSKIDALDEEINKLEEVYAARIKLIDDVEDEESYSKKLTKVQEEAQKTRDQIAVLSRSDDLADKARRKDLEEKLAEQINDIAEMQHERELKLRKDSLQSELDAQKTELEKSKSVEQGKIDANKKTVDAQKQLLDEQKKTQEIYYDNLINDERTFYQLKQEIMAGNYSNATAQLEALKLFYQANTASIGSSISNNLIDKIGLMQVRMSEAASTMNANFLSISNNIQNTLLATLNTLIAKLSELSKINLDNLNNTPTVSGSTSSSGSSSNPYVDPNSPNYYVLSQKEIDKIKAEQDAVKTTPRLEEMREAIKGKHWNGTAWVYHTGGTVGKKPLAKGEVPAILKLGETVFTEEQMAKLQSMVIKPINMIESVKNGIQQSVSRISSFTPSSSTQAVVQKGNTIEGGVTFSFPGFSGTKREGKEAVKYMVNELNKLGFDF
ncbi:phage tail tape measure protein [Paenibacillus sp. FSL H3-0333]|uniref:phage tail tape measure protein n=1 Tax=Paenibacillus sp. FSL H3-0333 TaxID=2921373 RepID=UPI0030FB369A